MHQNILNNQFRSILTLYTRALYMFLGPFGTAAGFITTWPHANFSIHKYQGPCHRPPGSREQPAHFNSQFHNITIWSPSLPTWLKRLARLNHNITIHNMSPSRTWQYRPIMHATVCSITNNSVFSMLISF